MAVTEEILVNVTPQETRVAVVEQGVTQEVHIERASAGGLVGNIYMGRVTRVLPGMQSAFIDVGGERAAFLHIADIRGARQDGDTARPIEQLLSDGQNLLVQVVKDPIGTKGARLSTQISIAGRFLVYLPRESHIGISQRIEDEGERAHLRETLRQLLPQEDRGGYIIRTVAETASDRELRSDVDYLRRLWAGIQERAAAAAPLALLYQDLNLALRVLRDFVHEETARILVDSRESCRTMVEFGQEFTPGIAERVEHYRGERPLFDLYGVEDEIEKALARRVDLKSGGYLVIDQTEALSAVDVNTGGFVTGRSFDDTVFRTNLEAAQVIARQLRLRNLGGIIVIDFIDMNAEEHRHAVLNELRKALARDRTHMTVNGFTGLGLVEMTRKRTRESLAQVLCEPCAVCGGRARLKSAQTVCYAILRELERDARQFNAREYRILAAQPVIDLFLDEEAQALALLSAAIGRPVSLQVGPSYHPEQYDLILM
ncbi:MAG: ribonuclease G [Panacagrimonas sp.]